MNTDKGRFQPSDYAIEYLGYVAAGWCQAKPGETADATFFDIHERKPFAADFAAGTRGVVCMGLAA